jgi:hypothetical protein
MIDFIKHIWSGSLLVKSSVVFLALVILVCLIADPGRVIFTGLFIGAAIAILNRIDEKDQDSNE